ncbi:hypothetical protein Syun_025344 [Stephania yunnanensis]|uniref:RRM domain-containing protein n=1 Tax=Stephania yunnanensis TaxID=152371 RepID=A0AAP0ES05_9MAGN
MEKVVQESKQLQIEAEENSKFMESDLSKLFIGGISWDTNEDRLKDYFQNFGEVVEAVIMKDRTASNVMLFFVQNPDEEGKWQQGKGSRFESLGNDSERGSAIDPQEAQRTFEMSDTSLRLERS